MNWGAEGCRHCPGSALPSLSKCAQGHCLAQPAACAGGNSDTSSFHLLEQIKSTTACLTTLKNVKAFRGKGNIFLFMPCHVKWCFPWGVCISGACTENQPRFVSPELNIARASELAVCRHGVFFGLLSLTCSMQYMSDPAALRWCAGHGSPCSQCVMLVVRDTLFLSLVRRKVTCVQLSCQDIYETTTASPHRTLFPTWEGNPLASQCVASPGSPCQYWLSRCSKT